MVVFFPGAATGWYEGFAGLIFSLTLRTASRRRMPGVVGSLTPWHLRQTSYSKLTSSTRAPWMDTPREPRVRPVAVGAVAGVGVTAWGLWQSTHATCRGIRAGSSLGSWVHWLQIGRASCR